MPASSSPCARLANPTHSDNESITEPETDTNAHHDADSATPLILPSVSRASYDSAWDWPQNQLGDPKLNAEWSCEIRGKSVSFLYE